MFDAAVQERVRTVQPGDRLMDNDPRRLSSGQLRVSRVDAEHVYAINRRGRELRIQRKRVHLDGKVRTKGFRVVLA